MALLITYYCMFDHSSKPVPIPLHSNIDVRLKSKGFELLKNIKFEIHQYQLCLDIQCKVGSAWIFKMRKQKILKKSKREINCFHDDEACFQILGS